MSVELTVNHRRSRVNAANDRQLLAVLRDELTLPGSKYGCGEGQCGACTVLLDGKAVRACQTPVKAAEGKQITTIEGLERNGQLHPLQQAFIEENALQCGYCTAGMIMAAAALLETTPSPTHDQIVRAMNGNVCRCGAYPQIVAAIQRASREMQGKPQEPQKAQRQEQRP